MTLSTLDDLDIAGKRVLIRADLNVPLRDGAVADDFRIRSFLPTLERVLERGGRALIASHLGRPKGKDAAYTLAPVAAELSAALADDVPLVSDFDQLPELGPDVRVALLENIRFHPGETKNDPAFAHKLSSLADVYVNDAFGSCHRAHASIVGPPAELPSAAGLLLQREIESLSKLLPITSGGAERPYVVVLGGAKVADKIGVVKNLLEVADRIIIGGGMCFTFLKARGMGVGDSLVDTDAFIEVSGLVWDDRLMLPTDIVVADGFEATEAHGVVRASEIPAGTLGLDIGPTSAAAFAEEIAKAKTVFWNGPMGVFEKPAFADGTRVMAQAVADCRGFTATGGGDTAAALAAFGFGGEVDFESTGGGASLEFLEGKDLPGIAALMRRPMREAQRSAKENDKESP